MWAYGPRVRWGVMEAGGKTLILFHQAKDGVKMFDLVRR